MLRNRAKALISPGTDRSQIMPSLRGSVLPKGEPKMKKNVSILLVFLLLCALLSGCSRQKNAANAQPPSAVPETTTQVASASAQASAVPDIDLETGKIRLTLAGVSMQTLVGTGLPRRLTRRAKTTSWSCGTITPAISWMTGRAYQRIWNSTVPIWMTRRHACIPT